MIFLNVMFVGHALYWIAVNYVGVLYKEQKRKNTVSQTDAKKPIFTFDNVKLWEKGCLDTSKKKRFHTLNFKRKLLMQKLNGWYILSYHSPQLHTTPGLNHSFTDLISDERFSPLDS